MEYYYDSQDYFLWSVYLCWYREKLYFLSEIQLLPSLLVLAFHDLEQIKLINNTMCILPHLRVMKQNEKEMVPQEEDTDYDLKQYTECRAVDTMVVSADMQL